VYSFSNCSTGNKKMLVHLFDHITFSLTKPERKEINQLIEAQYHLPFSYPDVGATRDMHPDETEFLSSPYRINHHRVRLGCGEDAYLRAKEALRKWAMFRLKWVEFCWPDVTLKPGINIAILGQVKQVWFLNVSRIVYCLDEDGPKSRFGFGTGTLPGHVVRGEERFVVEWDRKDGGVWYELLSFSQESHPIVAVSGNLHAAQKRFAQESGGAMVRFMREGKILPWA
jgi:uncharacterized protein (UPF0548 family)